MNLPGATLRRTLKSTALILSTLLFANTLSGCIVAGVSSSGGAFIWPGGLGLVLLILVIIFVLRRR